MGVAQRWLDAGSNANESDYSPSSRSPPLLLTLTDPLGGPAGTSM